MTNPGKCAVCGVTAAQKCGGCRNVVYCGKEHQIIHWKKGHKAECKCYEVAINDILGRHLRATRDIRKGEIFLREKPFIYGPKVASAPVCLGCHRTLTAPEPPQKNYYKCTRCTWPMCGPHCERSLQHVDECEIMAARKFNSKIDYYSSKHQTGKKESAYCVILPLRCILLHNKNPEAFARFAQLEDHLSERVNTPLYNILSANLLTFIKTIMGFSEWSDEDVLRVAARLDTNAFEIRQPATGQKLRAVYANAAMISHDCISNARHTFDEQMQILFIAKQNIAKGEIIATSYTQPLKCTLMRRQHLQLAKCFDCICTRCKDPEELGTFAGAILCRKCKVGKIISTDPLDNGALWKCQLCPHEIPAKQVNWGNNAMVKEIESLNKTSPRALEEFIHRYRDTLHEKNTHMLQVKYALTQLYGNAPGFLMHEMTDGAVKRKVELCQELLEVADILDGGWSIFRGNLLLDLQEALVVQAKREFKSGLLTKANVQEKLAEAMELLKEAVEIMKLEPDMQEVLKERTQQLADELDMD
ncbi:SET domain-containing protein SmydA-8-like [Rhagoletis pomonella]|uniref:SET domain-containing protein SmydA-8-like n=1 Tax=Rhagoletis pomonella TaxID=28610 RepID=UPI0017812638|nr:SET domain-containing protein SmydA-8-like [Rhagoletis pomonella]